jgi:hypothetical protein
VAALALLSMALPAVADKKKKKEDADYVELLRVLPGDYDNLAQAQDEHSAQHASVVLSIKPLDLQTLGRLALLVRETAADDPRRLLAQRIWIFTHGKNNEITQQVYVFKEPQRWIHAGEDPLVMQALMPDDLGLLAGCELLWVKTADGFTGATRPRACRPSAAYEGVLIETQAQLNADDLTLTEQQAGQGGRLPAEVDPASAYHFQRRGG